MKALKFIIPIVIVLLLILGGFATAVYAVTAPPEFAPKAATLTVERGTASLQKAGSDSWVTVVGVTEIASGDVVRTGPDSEASVNYFDQGVARLDADTTVRFDEITWDPLKPTTFVGKVKLDSGRLWSRVFDFLTPESAYEVETANTVATVRGTSFFVEAGADADEVFVADHAVNVKTISATGESVSKDVAEGQMARVDRLKRNKDRITIVRDLPEAKRTWVKRNLAEDQAYEEEIGRKNLEEAKKMRRIDSTSPLYGFVAMAEDVRLAATFDSNSKNELKKQFAANRLIEAYVAVEEGDQAAAERILQQANRFELDAQNKKDPLIGQAMIRFNQGQDEVPVELIEAMNAFMPAYAESLQEVMLRRETFDAVDLQLFDDSGTLIELNDTLLFDSEIDVEAMMEAIKLMETSLDGVTITAPELDSGSIEDPVFEDPAYQYPTLDPNAL